MLALYSRRSVILKRVSGDATSAVCRLRNHALKHYMPFQTFFRNTRNASTERNETKAVVKSNTCRRSA